MEKTTPKYLLILCFISLMALIPVPAEAQAEKLEGLDDFIVRGMADWQIPGLGISIVKDGEIIYEKGFGVRKLGDNEKVDQHTVFGIASTTKAMTVTALAMLVDEGKIGWDDRVRDHLPWFELSDRLASDLVTIRDLLSHQVGIGRMTGNRLVFMPKRDRRTMLKHVAHQPLEIPFRSGYVYSNVMYMVAGMIIEEVEGISWDEFLPLRLFAPLGMNSASVSITGISDDDNAAWPHQEIDGVVRPIPRRNFDNVGPAASVNASANDMAQWMLLNLGEPGKYKDTTLVSIEVMKEIFQPQHAFRVRDPSRSSFSAYAMGWNSGSYDDYRLLQHSGATDGMNSMIVLLPELELGIFIAGNLFCEFRPAVVSWIIDRQAGIERDHDWNERFHSRYMKEKEEAMMRKKEIEDARVTGTAPTLEPQAYAGNYHNMVYDDVEVKIGNKGKLELHFWGDEEMVADLEHWHYDTFRATWRNPAMGSKFVNFDLDQDGKVRQLNVNFTLRPVMTEVGNYPAASYRIVEYKKLLE
jgi:CubicO group peptidase (beta-lactamase class C family)